MRKKQQQNISCYDSQINGGILDKTRWKRVIPLLFDVIYPVFPVEMSLKDVLF